MKREYLYKVFTQKQQISGPPIYLPLDWKAAKQSVMKLLVLNPSIAVTGHGIPMSGKLLTKSLNYLADHFEEVAGPEYGKYIDQNFH